MKTQNLAYLRPDQIIEEMQRRPLAYLPVGPLEWHGPHLPLGVDPLNAENAALQAADQTGGLVFPTLYWGTERERSPEMLNWLGLDPESYVVGMDFPANSLPSLYCSEEILALLVREQLNLAVKFGFRLIVIVTGHAATNQIEVLQRLAAEFNGNKLARVIVVLPFVTNPSGIMEVGHASRIETSVMQALYPHTVRLENLPPLPEPLRNADWAVVDYETFLGSPTPDRTIHEHDDPRLADPERGHQTIQLAVSQIVSLVQKELEAIANPSQKSQNQ
jgi:creatinine amidohydrolase